MMTTDEQIIAAAGEPVAHVVKDDEGEQLMYPAAIFKYKMASEDDIICDLYTADAILAAAQPLRERIAELEAEVRQLRATPPEQRQDLHCVVSDISSECRELRQQNAELTKQRDGLLLAVTKIKSDAGKPERVWRLAKEAIAAHKTGGAA